MAILLCSLLSSPSLPSLKQPALLDPEELLVRFLQRVLLWLEENHARIINLFRKLDSDNDNVLSKEDFFIGMRMMDVRLYYIWLSLWYLVHKEKISCMTDAP